MASVIDLAKPIHGADNFSWEELVRTSDRNLQGLNRLVPAELEEAGVALAQMLQVVRDRYQKPLVVHSGFRCAALNEAQGGSASSQHVKFQAADFHVAGVALGSVFHWLAYESGLPFGQIIQEGWDPPNQTSWIHLSLGEPFRPAKNREVLMYSMKTGKYTRLQ